MPIDAVPRIASCSRSRRAATSAWRRRSVMSSAIQTVPPCCVFFSSIALAMMWHRKVEPSLRRTSHSMSSCRPEDRIGIAIWPSAA